MVRGPNDDAEVLFVAQLVALYVSTEPVSLRVLLEIAIATRAARDSVRLAHILARATTRVNSLQQLLTRIVGIDTEHG